MSRVRRHWRRIWRVGLGSVLVILGIILIPLPGPGLLICIAGLAVMADEVPAAHRIMQALKRKVDEAKEKASNRRR